MNDTDVQAPNTDCNPKLHKNYKLVLEIWLDNHNVVPGSTKMLTQEHVSLGNDKKMFIYSVYVGQIKPRPWVNCTTASASFALHVECFITVMCLSAQIRVKQELLTHFIKARCTQRAVKHGASVSKHTPLSQCLIRLSVSDKRHPWRSIHTSHLEEQRVC